MNCKVLIVTASIGSGHTRAAEAVRSELLARNITDTTVVDFLDSRDSLSALIKETYFKVLRSVPQAYELLYQWSQGRRTGTNFINLTALLMKRRLQQILLEYHPDLVIFTHPFPCCAGAYLRRTRQTNCRLAAVLTDFAAHRLWLHREVDAYFVASEEMKADMVDAGIDGAIISVSGIPIDRRFGNRRADPEAAGGSLLLMGGGTGHGALEKACASLATVDRNLAITVVTGSNRHLQERLHTLAWSRQQRVEILGYTDKIDELMAGAALLITKPGALSCSEALAVGLPLILIDPIPGQEEDNASYLVRQGCAVRGNDLNHLGKTVRELLDTPSRLAYMHKQALNAGRPKAAADIARIIDERFITRRYTVKAG